MPLEPVVESRGMRKDITVLRVLHHARDVQRDVISP